MEPTFGHLFEAERLFDFELRQGLVEDLEVAGTVVEVFGVEVQPGEDYGVGVQGVQDLAVADAVSAQLDFAVVAVGHLV